jgi:hypothetical protein
MYHGRDAGSCDPLKGSDRLQGALWVERKAGEDDSGTSQPERKSKRNIEDMKIG